MYLASSANTVAYGRQIVTLNYECIGNMLVSFDFPHIRIILLFSIFNSDTYINLYINQPNLNNSCNWQNAKIRKIMLSSYKSAFNIQGLGLDTRAFR